MTKAKTPRMTTAHSVMRKRLRAELHAQLDALLNGLTVENDGTEMLTLDSMTMRALAGYGVNVRVHSLSPDQMRQVHEAAATVTEGPKVGLVREQDDTDPNEGAPRPEGLG